MFPSEGTETTELRFRRSTRVFYGQVYHFIYCKLFGLVIFGFCNKNSQKIDKSLATEIKRKNIDSQLSEKPKAKSQKRKKRKMNRTIRIIEHEKFSSKVDNLRKTKVIANIQEIKKKFFYLLMQFAKISHV